MQVIELQVPGVGWAPAQRRPRIPLVGGIRALVRRFDYRSTVQVARHTAGGRRVQAGPIALPDGNLVDEPRQVLVAGDQAQRQLLAQRQVQHRIDAAIGLAVGVFRRAAAGADIATDGVETGPFRNEADRAGLRAGAVQGALWTAQHFHAFDVVQGDRKEYRRLAKIGRHGVDCLRGHVGAVVAGATRAVGAQAAQRQIVGVAAGCGTGVDRRQAWHYAREFAEPGRARARQLVRADDADVVWNRLHVLFAPLRSDDDLLEHVALGGRILGLWRCRELRVRNWRRGKDQADGRGD